MIKKLIYLFCGTLVLTACGNSIEKKANEKLVIAKAAYERGDYEEAKTQIDSIKILYPKAFEARKAGQELMLDVELKAQQKHGGIPALRKYQHLYIAIYRHRCALWVNAFPLWGRRKCRSQGLCSGCLV